MLSLSAPEAGCTAGPAGSSGGNFTATESLATATLDVENNGKSVLPNGPIQLASGNILTQLTSALPSNPLSTVLGQLPAGALAANPLGVTINPGSTTGANAGPTTTATAGELGLSVAGNQVLSLVGAKAVCGANNQAKSAVTPESSPSPTPVSTSSETPLTGIQTDEGMYVPPARGSDTALWAGLAAAGVALAGGAGGVALRRRRLRRS